MNDYTLILDLRLELAKARGTFEGIALMTDSESMRLVCRARADEIAAILEKHFGEVPTVGTPAHIPADPPHSWETEDYPKEDLRSWHEIAADEAGESLNNPP